MKKLVLVLLSLLSSCEVTEQPKKLKCKLISVQESFQFYTTDDIVLTKYDLFYDSKGEIRQMEVNSNNTSRRASYTLNIKEVNNSEKVYEFRYADGFLAIDTIKFNTNGYRTQIRKRFSGSTQAIFDYGYDSNGLPTTYLQKDNTGKIINQAKWVVENGNLIKYQNLKGEVYEDTEVYEYDNKLQNEKLYYLGNYHLAYSLGKAPKNILTKITKGENVFTYFDYVLDENGNITSFSEKFTPAFDLPYLKKVKLTYDFCQ